MLSPIQNESARTAATRPARFGFRSAIVALLTLAVAGACGPSVQSIYEGNVRFEHCYRLDLEVDTAPTHREACWKEWLSLYTYGQPHDRIEYARRRAHAFASGDIDRPQLNVSDDKKAEARQFYLVVPAPTSVHAPPAPMATRWYGDAGTAPAASAAEKQPAAPQDQCAATCHDTHSACAAACGTDAGKNDPGCMGCDPNYKTCMKRCFQ